MSTGEPVLKNIYALHLYSQQVAFVALVDKMQEHGIGINLLNFGVRNYIGISSRQEYLGRCRTFAPHGENHSRPEKCSQSLSPRNAIYTVQEKFGDRDSRFKRDPLKLLVQVHYGSERKASYRTHVRGK